MSDRYTRTKDRQQYAVCRAYLFLLGIGIVLTAICLLI